MVFWLSWYIYIWNIVLLIPKKHFEVCEICSTFCRQHADRWDPIREILAINGYSLRNGHDFGPCPLWFSIFVASKLGCTTGWFDTAGVDIRRLLRLLRWWVIFSLHENPTPTRPVQRKSTSTSNLMGMDNENQQFSTGQSGRYWFDFVFGVIPCDPMDMSWIYSVHFFADSSTIFKPRSLNSVHLIRHGCSLTMDMWVSHIHPKGLWCPPWIPAPHQLLGSPSAMRGRRRSSSSPAPRGPTTPFIFKSPVRWRQMLRRSQRKRCRELCLDAADGWWWLVVVHPSFWGWISCVSYYIFILYWCLDVTLKPPASLCQLFCWSQATLVQTFQTLMMAGLHPRPPNTHFVKNGMSWYVLANMFSKYFYWRV